MIIVIAQLGAPAMVGEFSLALAITAPVVLFTNLHLRAIQAADAGRRYSFSDYLGLRLISLLPTFGIIIAIIVGTGYEDETAQIIILVGLAKALESISDIFYGLFQQRERMDRIAQSMTIKGVLSLAALAAGIYLTNRLLWGVVGLIVAWLIVLIVYDLQYGILMAGSPPRARFNNILIQLKQTKAVHPRWIRQHMWQLAWLALPLGFVRVLSSLFTNIPRYFVEGHLGQHELGIFAALAYLIVVGNRFILALVETLLPRMGKLHEDKDIARLRNLVFKVLAGAILLGCGVVVGTILFGQLVVTFLYGSQFAQDEDVLLLLMVSAALGFLVLILQYVLTAVGYFRVQVFSSLAAIISIIIFSAILIPSMGLAGAAWASVLAAAIQLLANAVVSIYALRVSHYKST
jgi:O-antigen/teichoic acid export membrane protein